MNAQNGKSDQRHEPISGREAGRLVHVAIAELLSQGHTAPTMSDMLGVIVPLVENRVSGYRQAGKVALLSGTAVYFRRFLPPAPWRFEAAEVVVPGARLDLLFRDDADRYFSDEVKTGQVARSCDRTDLEEQVERGLRGARAKFGDSFLGIRAAILGAPGTSYVRPETSGDAIPREGA